MNRRLLVTVLCVGALSSCRCGGGPVPVLPEKVVGKCTYINGFSKAQECKDYVGNWTEADATSDCDRAGSTIVLGEACNIEKYLGYCIWENDIEKSIYTRITFPGEDPEKCGSFKRGCEFFGGGIFDPATICGGVEDTGVTGLATFQQPTLICKDPMAGEAPGSSAGGQVCTWSAIAGATEEGRDFRNYGSCDQVRTQRPYYPAKPAISAGQADERMNDPEYTAELTWVTKQVTASACVCCHSNTAPAGSSNWFIESGPNWVWSMKPRGLAMGAGWIDTVGFGSYPKDQNNGFSRPDPTRPNESAFPTTDPARMAAFFEKELTLRGLTRKDFESMPYGAGPLDDQRFFRPEPCKDGEGIQRDGTILWGASQVRYVYILEADAASPTVPPNLDLPAGTLWRIDVPHTGQPLFAGTVKYGQVPPGAKQMFPAGDVRPPALQVGKQYYLYALVDVGIPQARCLATVQ